MAATIIDSLIVTLGINASSLNSQSVSSINKLRQIETQAGKTEKSVDGLSSSFGKLLAVFGGAYAIRRFIEDTIDANAALNRFSKNIGLEVSTVSAWGNAVEQLGGSSRELQGTFDMLSKAQTELRLTGQSGLIPYFSALGVAIAGVGGQARPVDQILLDLSDRFSHMDRTTANNMGRMMGINQDTLNLLLQGRKEVELVVAREKELNAVTKAQAEEASKQQRTLIGLKQQFNSFGRELLQMAAPAIEKVLDILKSLGDWIRENQEVTRIFLGVLAVGLAAVGIAAIPINLTVLAVTALAAAIALLYQDYQVWKRGGDSLIDWGKWRPAIELATAAIDKLSNAISRLRDKYREMRDDPHTRYDTFEKFGLYKNRKPTTAAATDSPEVADSSRIRKFFTDKGWSPAQAAGIAANLISESGGRANASGDGGSAYGLAQWHPDRQKAFKEFAGKDIRNSSIEDQLAFVHYELTKGNEQKAGDALKRASTPQDAASIISRRYERPLDSAGEASRRGDMAALLMGVKGASATVAGASPVAGGGGSVDRSVTNNIDRVEVITRATDADGIARDIGSSLENYSFVSQANRGLD